MINILKYTGTYTDSLGTTRISIENDFSTLYAEIDGIKFQGSEFSGLAIIDKSNYSESQLNRFTFWSVPIYNTDIVEEVLCNCLIEIPIHQVIIDKSKNNEILGSLIIKYSLGNERPKPKYGLEFERVKLTLTVAEERYQGEGELFETALDQIHKQIEGKYCFKNCYGCLYADYHYLGQSGFGNMLCFIKQKEQYLNVKSKIDYTNLSTDFDTVQEIYCCDNFQIRVPGTGYRG